MNQDQKPKTLSEAIAKLESVGQTASQGIKEDVARDFSRVNDALLDVAPFVEQVASEKTGRAKSDVEEKIRQNPWLIVGVVGVIAFFIGWIIGKNKKSE